MNHMISLITSSTTEEKNT